jgi:hypothetical protein
MRREVKRGRRGDTGGSVGLSWGSNDKPEEPICIMVTFLPRLELCNGGGVTLICNFQSLTGA